MGVFVRIEAGDDARSSRSPALRFLGMVVVDEMRAVANYELRHVIREAHDDHCIARLEAYPRWSEPGLALVARLVGRSEPGFLADSFGEHPLRITLSVGPSPMGARVVERITTQKVLESFGAVMISEVRQIEARMPLLRPDATLRDAVLEVSRWTFGWHQQSGPLPAPLTEVPIRQGPDGPLVALADIPPHARAHFARCLHLDDSETVAPAQLWLYFIGEILGADQ
jgi:hypothetical protein